MVQIVGKYKLVHKENHEGYLGALGVNVLMRKAADKMISGATFEVRQEADGKYSFAMSTAIKQMSLGPFELGVAFEERTPDGRECDTTVEADGDVWTQRQVNRNKAGKDAVIVRTFHDGGVDFTLTCDGVVAKHKFERLP